MRLDDKIGSILKQKENEIWCGANIGAPPKEKALAGRANVEGSQSSTVQIRNKRRLRTRPPLGFYVSVATMKLTREARILDLTKDVELNPFTRSSLGWFVEVESLLDAFGEEMSRPLERDDDKTRYVPCQRLADYIER